MAYPPLPPNAWLRYSLICELLDRLPSTAATFVEVGCGVGAVGARLADRFHYTGYEPDTVSFNIARSRIKNGVVVHGFLPDRPTQSFDVLGAFEVLEHHEDDGAVLAAWAKWVRPGGYVLLSVPANPARFTRFDASVGHYRRYTATGLAAVLRRAGFDDVVTWSYGFPLGYALEFARTLLAHNNNSETFEARTAASGRFLQPSDGLGWIIRLGTAPFCVAQRPFKHSSLGTGLIAIGKRRDDAATQFSPVRTFQPHTA